MHITQRPHLISEQSSRHSSACAKGCTFLCAAPKLNNTVFYFVIPVFTGMTEPVEFTA